MPTPMAVYGCTVGRGVNNRAFIYGPSTPTYIYIPRGFVTGMEHRLAVLSDTRTCCEAAACHCMLKFTSSSRTCMKVYRLLSQVCHGLQVRTVGLHPRRCRVERRSRGTIEGRVGGAHFTTSKLSTYSAIKSSENVEILTLALPTGYCVSY